MRATLRRLLARLLLGIEKTTISLRKKTLIEHGAQIGHNVFFEGEINDYKDAPLLTIEDGATIARGTLIILHDSSLNNVHRDPIKFGRVRIGRESFIGANCTILCGVEIGAGAIVGAHSLVSNDIPPETVAAGVPARVIGTVQELSEKQNRLARAPNDGVGYLDSPPWRDIKGNQSAFLATHLALMKQLSGRIPDSQKDS